MMRCAFAASLAIWQGEIELDLPDGATAQQALEAARLKLPLEVTQDPLWASAPVGIFGEPCSRERVLNAGDRLEIYRPLAVDPKEARRARASEIKTEKGRNPLTAKPTRRG